MKKIIGLWLLALVIGFGVVGIANAGLDKQQRVDCERWGLQTSEYKGLKKTEIMKEVCKQVYE